MSVSTADVVPTPTVARRPEWIRWIGLLAGIAALLGVALASIMVGARTVPAHTVFNALFHYTGSYDQIVVRDLRLPRTLIGLAVGAGLGLSGAIMQALTRNPLADPDLLGVNSDAAAAVVFAIGVLGLTSPGKYVWFAFSGAAFAAVVVYQLGTRSRAGATPIRLALAGTAITAALSAFTSAMVLLDSQTFDAVLVFHGGTSEIAAGALAGGMATALAPELTRR
jgi:iron complex transport system permease protein